MTRTAKAVVIPRRHTIELRDVEIQEPGQGEVMIRTAYTSISSGTERMLLEGKMPHPALSFPVVPGYETVGQVVEVGAGVDPALQGQWVYVGGARCYVDVNPAWGGQAQYLTTAAERLVTLNSIKPETGVLLALAATALHGINLSAIQPGDRVLVLGQGIVGQLAARLAKLAGAAHVAVLDRVEVRLAASEADQVINVARESLEEANQDEPFAVIVEATGSMDALRSALPLLANQGRIVLLGYYEHLDLPYPPLFMHEARLIVAREWSFGPDGDLPRVRDMIDSGQLRVDALITHRVPLERIQAAYRLALEDPTCLKLVVAWA